MISMYFGSPGSGKTTTAVRLLVQYRLLKRYDHFYANFNTKLATYVNARQLGAFAPPPGSVVMIDESGIEFNNRNFNSLPKECLEFFKLHRHYGVDLIFFSQSWEDSDIVIRRLVDELYHVRSLLWFTRIKKIYKNVGIDSNTHQIIDEYKFGLIFGNLIGRNNFCIFLRNGYYRFFDSYDRPNIPLITADYSFSGQKFSFFLRLRHAGQFMRKWFKTTILGRITAVLLYFVGMLLLLGSCVA